MSLASTKKTPLRPIFWRRERLFIIDQTALPFEYKILEIKSAEDLVAAIQRLAIRGAPALGVAAAYGLVLGLKPFRHANSDLFFEKLNYFSALLVGSRPTAVNISWALTRLNQVAQQFRHEHPNAIWQRLRQTARQIHNEDLQKGAAIATNGLQFIPQKARLLTHCNTGSLATGGSGTALGIIFKAHQAGRQIHVFVDETRPLLQGARLTAWELHQAGIPFTLITDNMAAYVMERYGIDAVLVGADRIARNGDTANKIGTYNLAILAAYHHIPFYVVAPSSSIDGALPDGAAITIEQRSSQEVTHFQGQALVPPEWDAISPAFDITPAHLITAIITENGCYQKPFNFAEK